MIDVALAIALHAIAVVWWLGGVAFVTTVMLPRLAVKETPRAAFADVERRFAPQARAAVLLAGASGLYLVWRLDDWGWFASAQHWWLPAMAAYWLVFFVILFLAEPLGWFGRSRGAAEPAHWLRRLIWLHGILLAAGLVIVGAATAGTLGWE